MRPRENVVDRAIGALFPRWRFQRERARVALDLLQRHYYDAASTGRRTQGWRRLSGDANTAAGPSLSRLRDLARDLERNNPYAMGGILDTIETETIGWGIVPTAKHDAFKAWCEGTSCDADGRQNLAGLEKLVLRSVARDGEVLVRRRWRRLEDGLPLPLQLQVLEADYLDTLKDAALPNGGRIVQGVEFDPIGTRVAYWLFREHPGSTRAVLGRSVISGSYRVPATEVLHVFKTTRAGQVRAPSWFAPALVKFQDFDRYDDATLMKQLIAACLAVITSDVDGTAPALGTVDPSTPTIDTLEPGGIFNVPPGRTVEVVQPPRVNEYGPYSQTQLRAIAKPFGVTYESMTGDYSNVNYSSARMARIGYMSKVEDWRWRIMVPLLLNPVWSWAMEAALLAGLEVAPATDWTAPALPMVDPNTESAADQRAIRSGLKSLSEALRERGYQPKAVIREIADDNKLIDELGLVLDSDPRKTSAQGQTQARPAGATPPATTPDAGGQGDGGEDEGEDADEED